MTKEYLKTKEAAEILGVSPNALRMMCSRRKIAFYKNQTGTRNYFKLSDLQNWLTGERFATMDEIKEQVETKILQGYEKRGIRK